MGMRYFLLMIAVVVLVGPVSLVAADKPNVIYVMLDDAGYGAFGSKHVKTPTFDKMCREGMKFTQHYSGSAVCAPTRCVLMTGLHTDHCRRRDNTARKIAGSFPSRSCRPSCSGCWASTRRAGCAGRHCSSLWPSRLWQT